MKRSTIAKTLLSPFAAIMVAHREIVMPKATFRWWFAGSVLLLLLIRGPLNAQAKASIAGGGPQGGFVEQILFDPKDSTTLYVVSNRQIFKTTDAGEQWHLIHTGLVKVDILSLAIAPSRPATLYAAIRDERFRGGLMKSEDSGSHWRVIGPGLPVGTYVVRLRIDPNDSNFAYAVAQDQIFRTSDGGKSWKRIAAQKVMSRIADLGFSDLAIDPTHPSTVYAASGDRGLRKSTDRGNHWSTIYKNDALSVLPDPSDPSTIYIEDRGNITRSLDGGRTWSRIDPPQRTYSYQLSVSSTEPGTLYAVSFSGQTYKSSNKGESWVQLAALRLAKMLTSDPMQPGVLYAAASGGLFKSSDGGANWSPAHAGLGNMSIFEITVAPSNSSVLYVAGPGGISRSTDGGETWRRLGPQLTGTFETSNGPYTIPLMLTHLAVDPFDAEKVYAGTDQGAIKSVDGGATWSMANAGMLGTSVYFPCIYTIFIDRTNPTVIYATASADGKAFKSTDSGNHWTGIDFGFKRIGGGGLMINPADPSVLFATTWGYGIIASTDGGKNWQRNSSAGASLGCTIGEDGPNIVNDAGDANILYAGCRTGISKSTDRGSTWTIIHPASQLKGLGNFLFDPRNPKVVYAMSERAGLVKSTDGGQRWKSIDRGLPSRGALKWVISPSDPSTLYLIDGGVFKSTDGGEHWRPTGTKE
jgi:photosystem II stability/assembly factor-like uncharacterized protein